MNSITLVGRVAIDPETREVNSTPVTTFRLAVNRSSRDEEPDWFTIEVWGKQSELAQKLLSKGALIGVIGTLRLMKWNDRESGERRSRPVIRSSFFEVLQGRREEPAAGGSGGGESSVVRQLPQRIDRGDGAQGQPPAAAPLLSSRPADVPF